MLGSRSAILAGYDPIVFRKAERLLSALTTERKDKPITFSGLVGIKPTKYGFCGVYVGGVTSMAKAGIELEGSCCFVQGVGSEMCGACTWTALATFNAFAGLGAMIFGDFLM